MIYYVNIFAYSTTLPGNITYFYHHLWEVYLNNGYSGAITRLFPTWISTHVKDNYRGTCHCGSFPIDFLVLSHRDQIANTSTMFTNRSVGSAMLRALNLGERRFVSRSARLYSNRTIWYTLLDWYFCQVKRLIYKKVVFFGLWEIIVECVSN